MRPSGEPSAPVVVVSGSSSSSGDMFIAILLGCVGAFVVIVIVIGIIVLLRWRLKRLPVERSPLKTSSLSNTRCTNFSLNYLSPSPAPVNYSATAKVLATCCVFSCSTIIYFNHWYDKRTHTNVRSYSSKNKTIDVCSVYAWREHNEIHI